MNRQGPGAPNKRTLDYTCHYPHRKLRKTICLKFGYKAYAMFDFLECYMIQNDNKSPDKLQYYIPYNDDTIIDFIDDWGFAHDDRQTLDEVVKFLCSPTSGNYYDPYLFKRYKILTNHNYQEKFIHGNKMRDILEMTQQYILPIIYDVLLKSRSDEKNSVVRYIEPGSKLMTVRWKKKPQKEGEANDQDGENEEQSYRNRLANLEISNGNNKNKGIHSGKNEYSEHVEFEETNELAVPLIPINQPLPIPLTTTSKTKQNEVKQNDSFANSLEFASSKDDTTLGNSGGEMSNDNQEKEKKPSGISSFVLAVRNAHAEWTRIPFVNNREDNTAIKKIANTIEQTVRSHKAPEILTDEQVMPHFLWVCNMIFNEKNWQKLPNYLHDTREYTTIAKNLKTIITKICPLPRKKPANTPQHRTQNVQNQPEYGPSIPERNHNYGENSNQNSFSPERITDLTDEELIQKHQEAKQANQGLMAEMLEKEMSDRKMQINPLQGTKDKSRSGKTQSIGDMLTGVKNSPPS